MAFCGEQGSLANAFGVAELEKITVCLSMIEKFMASNHRHGELLLVRSEYLPGQFTQGDVAHPYGQVCVPGKGPDCHWAISPAAVTGKRVITKHQESVASVNGLARELLTRGNENVKEVLLTGFLTTSCVMKSAIDLSRILPKSVGIGVVVELTASRSSNYLPCSGDISRHDAALLDMQDVGVNMVGLSEL